LIEFFRVLKLGGVLRIATPDLDDLVQKYLTDWQNQDWLSWPGNQFIKTRGQMINISFQSWGHKFLYNKEDLNNQLTNSNFSEVVNCDLKESSYPELCNLETRVESKLIMEAKK